MNRPCKLCWIWNASMQNERADLSINHKLINSLKINKNLPAHQDHNQLQMIRGGPPCIGWNYLKSLFQIKAKSGWTI